MEIQNKRNWPKTKIFRTVLASFAMLVVVVWVCWFACDTHFLRTGLNFNETTHEAIPIDAFWHDVAYGMGILFVDLSAILIAGEVAYIVYRSFAWKTDKNKFIYEAIIHGIICLLMIIFLAIAGYRLFNGKWLAKAEYNQPTIIYDIDLYHKWFTAEMAALGICAIFSSVSLFQANKAFKFHNIYFDYSLMVAILAVVLIPVYIAAILLIKVHPGVEYPAEFWLHIAGQGLYTTFRMLKLAVLIFLTAKLILLIRLNSGQLQRTKKAIVIASILVGINLIVDLVCITFNYSVQEVYYNENWIPQIVLLSVSFVVAIISGWNSCYRYIELYAKPARNLAKEPMILN